MTKPALLGGSAAFSEPIPIVRPAVASFDDVSADIEQIFASGSLTKGAHLRAFEREAAAALGVDHVVAVSSCTTGLMLVYQALELSGSVVMPSFTFMATASAARWAGLRLRFVDSDPDTMNVSVPEIEAAIAPDTSAIVAVHNFGNPADIDAIEKLARRRNLRVVFDAAHALGSRYAGAPVAAQGDAQVYSLSPTKLVVAGEGGLVATNDSALADRIRLGREYGNGGDYNSQFAGLNGRMPELCALLGRKSLAMLEDAVARRGELAAAFRARIAGGPGIHLQQIRPEDRCSYKDLTIRVDGEALGFGRDDLARALAAENIETRAYYSPAVHCQTAYQTELSLPGTEVLASCCLSLPMWSRMDDHTMATIADALCRIIEHRSAIASHVSAP